MNGRRAAVGAGFGSVGCVFVVLALNLLLGGLATQYFLMAGLGLAVPFLVCAIAGLFLGQFTIPLAIIVWVLSFALSTPIVDLAAR